MATIQEIAKRAGTSVATVSHVINRTRFVSDELRGRVERAMRSWVRQSRSVGRSRWAFYCATIGAALPRT